jgi:hypothetical protein
MNGKFDRQLEFEERRDWAVRPSRAW